MEYTFYEHQAREFYRLLNHTGHKTQLHCQNVNTDQLIDRKLLNGEEEAISFAKKYNGQGNVFIGINPRDNDGSVSECTCLSLDIDPKRPKGQAATEEEWSQAVQVGQKLLRHFDYGYLFSSGNGILLLYPLLEKVSSNVAESMGRVLIQQAKEFITKAGLDEKVQVDHTFDAPRLSKFVGTISTKGTDTNLWRHARLINRNISQIERFSHWISQLTETMGDQINPAPPVERGTLDRSKADMALANRLKIQGFSKEDTLEALHAYATRPGREDDYQRIVQKVYGGSVQGGTRGAEDREQRALQLWTPANGIGLYQSRSRNEIPELPTGFAEIDRATFGLIRGQIFTVGGRTNCGKTSFAINVAAHLCGLSKRVLFISTETEFKGVWDRFIATGTGIPAIRLQNGTCTPEDAKVLELFMERFKQYQFTVYDGSRPNILLVRQAIEQANPDVVVIDYFQHVEGREVRELEEFVMSLKELAKEKQIAVLITAQLHDGPINPKTNRLYPPTMGSIKNCKVLNDESQVVALLDWERDEAQGDGPAAVKVLLPKNKGPRHDCVLKLNRAIPRFEQE